MSDVTSSTAAKDDSTKPDLSLLPRGFKEAVARVMMFGVQKYGRWNYAKGHSLNQLIAAVERHLDAIKSGEDLDTESNQLHWGHVAAGALMALHQAELGTLKDDRFKKAIDCGQLQTI